LNQEEAISFGAGFLAASLSRSFKVRPINVVQQSPYELIISIDNLYNETCTEIKKHQCSFRPFHYKSTLIKRRQSYDTAKTVSFNYRNDLTITLLKEIIMERSQSKFSNIMLLELII